VLSREYHNFVDRFWNEIRNSRSRINRSAPIPPDALNRFNRYESDESDSDEVFTGTTTTTSEEDEDVGEPLPAAPNGQNNVEANRAEAIRRQMNMMAGEQDGDFDDTTTSFDEENFDHSDNSEPTTTTTYESEENDTTTTDYIDVSSQQPRQRQFVACCAAAACRNRPAVDCVNSLCGRCCVLIGEYHCPRHNS